MTEKRCEVCGTNFVQKDNTTGRFCSRACYYEYQNSRTITCPVCKREYHPTHTGQKVCSKRCADVFHRTTPLNRKCAYCGKPINPTAHPRVRFCSRSCAMMERDRKGQLHAPEGTQQKHSSGYTLLKVGKRWVMEHRYIMEQILGRPLEKFEHVHHKNGVRNDNSPENLELWIGRILNKKDPPGQRFEDLLYEFLNQPEITNPQQVEIAFRRIFKL